MDSPGTAPRRRGLLLGQLCLVSLVACSGPEPGDAISDDSDGSDTVPCPTLYADSDADGFGDRANAIESCDEPAGYVDNDDDCDDASPSVNPGAVEVCDSLDVDEDCNGLADDTDVADGSIVWHADSDGDGFGEAAGSPSCDPPGSGYVLDGTDCDDASDAVHPGAIEVCGDGVDNDCIDGDVACTLPNDIDDAVVQWVGDGDGFGAALAGADVTGDGVGDLVVGAYISGSDYEGAAYVVAGPLSGTLDLKDATATISGSETEGALGLAVAATEDADGDGVADFFLGGQGLGGSLAITPGYAYLVTDIPLGELQVPDDAHAVFEGAQVAHNAGSVADDVGDVDGDGEIDFAIGAMQAVGIGQTGNVSLFYGPVSGAYVLQQDEDVLAYCATYCSTLGDTLTSGDLTGDGLSDIVIPINTTSYAGIIDGIVAVLSDPASSPTAVDEDADAIVVGNVYTSFGQVASVGDWNGDGYPDLASSDGTSPGTTYVLEGPFAGESSVGAAVSTFTGRGAYLLEGAGLALARTDLDHDGEDDLAIGAPELDVTGVGPGSAYVFLGPITAGAHSVDDAAVILRGLSGNSFGAQLASVGDTTGDGRDELAIVGRYYDGGAGSVWLFE